MTPYFVGVNFVFSFTVVWRVKRISQLVCDSASSLNVIDIEKFIRPNQPTNYSKIILNAKTAKKSVRTFLLPQIKFCIFITNNNFNFFLNFFVILNADSDAQRTSIAAKGQTKP